MTDIIRHRRQIIKGYKRKELLLVDADFATKAEETIDVGVSFIQQFCHLLLNVSLRLTLEMKGTHRIYRFFILFSFFLSNHISREIAHLNKWCFTSGECFTCSRNHDIFFNYYT